ncbi:MAG: UDP-N-acetylglucosamine 1-carboxyvinyltransferase [Clostridia bacterium]|nr:UDP-N-acetylglucosamine 1-carboxyvinyltransferase [Clostridia bacterium]
MLSYVIKGGNKLNGEVINSGSKNSALPILATSILNPNPVTFYNVPEIEDIKTTIKILRFLGCKIDKVCDKITISSCDINKTEIPEELMHKCRSTVILAGALIGRFKKASFSFPGGCNIGARPIDLHIKALKKLGVRFNENKNNIICKSKNIYGTKINLDFPSVGATENIILASVYANGTTKIYNSAREPEIIDLANCLNKMGAKVYGAGTNKITIVGVNKLKPINYRIMPDRIEAGTFLCATAITNGKIRILQANPSSLVNVLLTLKEIGCKISISNNTIRLIAPKQLKAISIETQPYPGFPTDLEPIFTALLTKAKGGSRIRENIFENRFEFCKELNKMGAKIKIENNEREISIKETNEIKGKTVKSKDLRGGASLVLEGLIANGTTIVEDAEYILRGYENLDKKLRKLGAEIKLINKK